MRLANGNEVQGNKTYVVKMVNGRLLYEKVLVSVDVTRIGLVSMEMEVQSTV